MAGDLGQIGKGNRRGYLCHNFLAVTADSSEVLGLVDQILQRRDQVAKDETLPEHRDRPKRESLLWVRGTSHLPADRRLIDVADQGADTFEFIDHEFRSGRRFVIRVSKPRKVHAGHQPIGPQEEIKSVVASLPELGRVIKDVPAQPGRKSRQNAEFAVRGGPVLVCPPHARAGHHATQRKTCGKTQGCNLTLYDSGGATQSAEDDSPTLRFSIGLLAPGLLSRPLAIVILPACLIRTFQRVLLGTPLLPP